MQHDLGDCSHAAWPGRCRRFGRGSHTAWPGRLQPGRLQLHGVVFGRLQPHGMVFGRLQPQRVQLRSVQSQRVGSYRACNVQMVCFCPKACSAFIRASIRVSCAHVCMDVPVRASIHFQGCLNIPVILANYPGIWQSYCIHMYRYCHQQPYPTQP